jgi:transcriptional regulator with XRE-family HTH domain
MPVVNIYRTHVTILRTAMGRYGITQMELARRSGVDQGNISRILAGKRPDTTSNTWDKLFNALYEEFGD